MKKLSDYSPAEQEEMRADAQNILNSPVVKFVFEELQEEYLQRLIQADVGDLTAQAAHASMKVLAEIRARLQLTQTSNRLLTPRNSRNL